MSTTIRNRRLGNVGEKETWGHQNINKHAKRAMGIESRGKEKICLRRKEFKCTCTREEVVVAS
jgi:hypothetical protein